MWISSDSSGGNSDGGSGGNSSTRGGDGNDAGNRHGDGNDAGSCGDNSYYDPCIGLGPELLHLNTAGNLRTKLTT